MNAPRIVAVNPGSSSTKLGWFEALADGTARELRRANLEHPQDLIALELWDQLSPRLEATRELLAAWSAASGIGAAAGRGGLLRALPGGTYRVDESMLADLRRGARGVHASNLGAAMARSLAGESPAFVVDPVSVDELEPVARVSGLPELPRTSQCHALNLRAAARAVGGSRLIVAHLGSGVSLAVFRDGRMIDVVNPREEGPFSPERAGGVPLLPFVRSCFEPGASWSRAEARLFREGGLLAHLGTRDLREVRRRVEAGDTRAAEVLDALAYQVAKSIGGLATVLEGRVEGIVLTGALAHDEELTGSIARRVGFVAAVAVLPGEDELHALAQGVARVLAGREAARDYS